MLCMSQFSNSLLNLTHISEIMCKACLWLVHFQMLFIPLLNDWSISVQWDIKKFKNAAVTIAVSKF